MLKYGLSFLLLIGLWVMTSAGVQNDLGSWSSAANMPTARKQITNSVVSLNGEIYVLGGVNSDGNITDAVEVYNPQTNTWRSAASMPLPLWRTMVAAVDGKIFMMGGYRSTASFPFSPTRDVYEYDPSNNEWTQKASMPSPRGMGAAVVLDGNIHVLAGALNNALRDHTIYDPQIDEWTSGPSLIGVRSGLAAGVIDSRIYAVGGYRLQGRVVSQKTVEMFDPTSNEWTQVADLPDTRHGISAAVIDEKLYVFGGLPVAVETHSFVYDPNTDTWTELADMPNGLTMAGAAAVDGTIYVIGGGVSGLGRTDGVNLNQAFVPPVK